MVIIMIMVYLPSLRLFNSVAPFVDQKYETVPCKVQEPSSLESYPTRVSALPFSATGHCVFILCILRYRAESRQSVLYMLQRYFPLIIAV